MPQRHRRAARQGRQRSEGLMYKEFIEKHYKELMGVLNCLKVGVYITDGKGDTMLLNDESCKTGGLTRDEVIGRNMKDLQDEGYVENSATLRTMKSGREESLIQNLGDGGKLFITGTPLFHQGQLDLVVCTERDITETLNLKELLADREQKTEKYKKEIEYLKMQNIVLWGNLIAEDEISKKSAETAMRVAKHNTTILLTGESGTGKEVYANFIYQNSNRVGKPFIKVNCAAIPGNLLESEMFGYEKGAFTGAEKSGKIGLFEMANHGTIFLDEIGEMPIHLQSKLLRVIQEKEIMHIGGEKTIPLDIRLIVATNRDLKKEVEEGRFREDLYYRLNIMPIELPPLRGRKKDIKALCNYFVGNFNREYRLHKTLDANAIEEFLNYEWPGNIRELENIIERLMISFDGDRITRFQVEKAIGRQVPVAVENDDLQGRTMEELLGAYEKLILERMLEKYKKPSEVARRLAMDKATLSRRIRRYGL
jgi:PAS domain S-box-containing protein